MGWVFAVKSKFQYYSDKLNLQFRSRWMATFVLACFYTIRVYDRGYTLITLCMGMRLSSLVHRFLTCAIDPDKPVSSDAPPRPIRLKKASKKLRPFVPILPEFKFWFKFNMTLCVALSMTFIPYLDNKNSSNGLFFFCLWFLSTALKAKYLRERMIEYNYIPFYYGGEYTWVTSCIQREIIGC